MNIWDWVTGNNSDTEGMVSGGTYVTGLDGVRRTQEDYDAWRLTDEAKSIYNPTANTVVPEGFLPVTSSSKFGVNNFPIIPWDSNPELSDILSRAAGIWGGGTGNITSDAWRLNDEAVYSQGGDVYFGNRPQTGAAVLPSTPQMLLPGENTAQYLESGGLNYSNILHELPHLSSKYFRFLNADGTVRPEWQTPGTKGLTGYSFKEDDDSYLKDYLNFVGLERDGTTQINPTGSWAAANFDQRAYNFTQKWLNEKDASGQYVNRQRGELKDAMGYAMGYILADDQLFADSGVAYPGRGYARAPEEVYARAMNTYSLLSEMSEEDRKFALNRKQDPYITPPDHIQQYTDESKSEFTRDYTDWVQNSQFGGDRNAMLIADRDYRKWDESSMDKRTEDGVTYGTRKYFRIRPQTYYAIDKWMKANKMNKAGTGFAQVELDNYLEQPLYA